MYKINQSKLEDTLSPTTMFVSYINGDGLIIFKTKNDGTYFNKGMDSLQIQVFKKPVHNPTMFTENEQ